MESRHDMYRNVHKALRRQLSQLIERAGTTDPGDPEELRALAMRWAQVKRLLDAHHAHEDEHIGPHLRSLSPSVFAEMEADHGALHVEMDTLDRCACSLRSSDVVGRTRIAHDFYLSLAAFVGRYFVHLDREERVYLGELQRAYADSELAAIEGAIVASIEPTLLATFVDAMLAAMSASERTAFLAATTGPGSEALHA